MKTLTILRHAKSSWKDRTLTDSERPLNARGERDAPAMAERLRDAGLRPSLIMSSPAVRAWTTARIVAKGISYPVEFLQREEGLYHASPARIIDLLAQQDPGYNSIMIVGHNPGLTDLANHFVPDLTNNIPTCGFVAVSFDSDDWNLRGSPAAELVSYDYPKRKT